MIAKDEFAIAVLMACYNRKEKTLAFLESLVHQSGFKDRRIDIYLLDDGSTDGTAAAVLEKYPQVDILTGTGNLFWAGGMRAIWKYAISKKRYDLFFLFNDDVVLFDNVIENFIAHYKKLDSKGVILVGSTLSPVSNKLSYGGNVLQRPRHAAYTLIEPDKEAFLPCQLGNANILMVDAFVVDKIGTFSDDYTHYFADYDYTLTAYKTGLKVLIAPGYYGYCEDDHGANWLSGNVPLKKRIEYLYSPKGLAYKEYLRYIKKHFPADQFSAYVKLWLKTLFPVIWDKFKQRGDK